jgi:hypothetical protein
LAKTYKNLYDPALTFSHLLAAHRKGKKRKTLTAQVIKFEMDLEPNIFSLYRELESLTYTPGGYKERIIYEPKKRLIKAAPYRDRVVHQWYIGNFIKPIFGSAFIFDTYACLDGKGTHRAAAKVQQDLMKAMSLWPDPYVIKGDIKDYFASILHSIIYNIVASKIVDPKVLWLTKVILDSVPDPGIPVGSYTSQWFANLVLHQLDMFVKHELKVKFHVRYMDDWALILPDKDTARETLDRITEFLTANLKLQLNSKTQILPAKNGVNFCGYKIKATHMKVRDDCKRKFKRKLRRFRVKLKNREMTGKQFSQVVNSTLGHIGHADSYQLVNKILRQFDDFIYVE